MALIKQYTIKREDVGKQSTDPHVGLCLCCGAEVLEFVFEPLGIVMTRDVGKRCYKLGEVWQVENEEQFRARIEKKFYS